MTDRLPRIAFVGDIHGRWLSVLDRLLEMRPDAAILVGDLHGDAPDGADMRDGRAKPLRDLLWPLEEAGIPVRWIPGNHDGDREHLLDATVGDAVYGPFNFHGRVEEISGLRLAGIGGVFRGQVWFPHAGAPDPAPAAFESRSLHLAHYARHQRWRGGLPLVHRTTIYPEDFQALAGQRADVLVTHEGPGAMSYEGRNGRLVQGFPVIDRLARDMAARLVVHGHHHIAYGMEADGIMVAGLGLAEVVLLEDLLIRCRRGVPPVYRPY